MHIVALVESPEHVCCRYRLRSVFAGLAAHGVSTELRPIPRGLAESLVDVIRDGDVIVTMGAGHISAMSHELPLRLAVKEGAA